MADYSFADSDLATRRLALLAQVYGPSTGEFIRAAVTEPPQLALDLGCGPGHTTDLLAEASGSSRAVGLDNSEAFILKARASETAGITFAQHDVTAVPFPVAPADLIFCRYLLCHLQDPASAIASWATQLCDQGLMLIEEVEWIDTDEPLFADYLAIVAALLQDRSQELYIGPLLDRLIVASLSKRDSAVREVIVSSRDAATLFHMNIQSWKTAAFIQEHYCEKEIQRIERELGAVSQRQGCGDLTWGLRQLVFARSERA